MSASQPPHSFLAFATYWPRSSGSQWWTHASLDELRRDFDAAAGVGFGKVGLELPWPEFQPRNGNVSAAPMRTLERVLDEIRRVEMRAILTLLPAFVGGKPALPDWAYTLVEVGGADGPRLTRVPRQLLRDDLARRYEARLVREVVGEFDCHPSVRAWVLGDRIAELSRPSDSEEYEEWLRFIADGAASDGSEDRFFHGLSARGVLEDPAVDPSAVKRAGMAVQIAVDIQPSWSGPDDAWVPFLAAYVRALAGSAPLVAHLRPDRLARGNALRLERMLRDVHDFGPRGAMAETLLDLRGASFRSVIGETDEPIHSGLLNDRGELTEAGSVWLHVAQQPMVQPGSVPFEVDLERRRRDPLGAARDAFETFAG